MTYLASYAFLQNAQCQPLKCQALNDVGNYCEESRCKNQWIPYLSLQERWTTRQAVAVNERMRVFLCERKQTCAAPAAVDCCVLWRGWEREKVERHIPLCPCSLSCPPWGEKWSSVSEEQSCGNMNCRRTARRRELWWRSCRRAAWARAPPVSYVQWVGKPLYVSAGVYIYLWFTIADCGTMYFGNGEWKFRFGAGQTAVTCMLSY